MASPHRLGARIAWAAPAGRWGYGLSGISALVCVSLTTAFSAHPPPRPHRQVHETGMRGCLALLPRGQSQVGRLSGATAAVRHGRTLVSLRTRHSLHGGAPEDGASPGAGAGSRGVDCMSSNSARPAERDGGRPKTVLTAQQEADRAARRSEIAQQRAERLAKIASGESGLGKVRQHVNPLAPAFREPIPSPDWETVYADTALPLHVDLGCGKGRMLLEMAKLHPERNFLGVEIREPLVVRADRWVREEELRNLHYVSGNINVSVKSLLASYPGTLDLVSVLMPDPWFKKRHKKRRLLQAELLSQLALLMRPGATFFVMSDVQEAAEDMVQILEESPDFTAWSGAWVDSPLELQTEREAACLSRGEPIFRAVFTRL